MGPCGLPNAPTTPSAHTRPRDQAGPYFATAAGAGPKTSLPPRTAACVHPEGTVGDNIARLLATGTITQGKVVKNSGPYGIVLDAEGDPWYTMLDVSKIAMLDLR